MKIVTRIFTLLLARRKQIYLIICARSKYLRIIYVVLLIAHLEPFD